MTARPRRWLVLAMTPLVAATVALSAPAAPATAAPGGGTADTADDGDDNPLLNEVLDTTGRRYLTARVAVAKSTKTQLALALNVRNAEARRDVLIPRVSAIAAQLYRTGGLSSAGFLLNSTSSDGF